ncbi:MAG: FtsX-like permease family protein [Acholeplasmataceae bacterium]
MLPFKIAFRFIFKSPIQNLLIIFSIIVGVGIQFFILAMSGTLSNVILEHTTSYNEHIIVSKKQRLTNYILPMDFSMKEQILSENPEISKANYYTFDKRVTLKYKSLPEISFIVQTVDNEDGFAFYGLTEEKHLKSGHFPTEKNQILLTKQFADQYMIENYDWVTLTFVRPDNVFLHADYQVVGTFDLGLYRHSFNYTVITIDALPEGYDFDYNSMIIQVENPRDVEKVAERIKTYFDLSKVEVKTWKEITPEISLLDTAQVIVTFLIQLFISIAIFIVVSSIIGFSVHQKSKQIGILKAMGLKDIFVSEVFLLQSLILGFFGAVGGLIGGTVFLKMYEGYMVYEDGSPRILINYHWYYYIISVGIIAATVLLASLISIRRAKKVSIIELIKT